VLATLVILLLTASGPTGMLVPFPNMESCERFKSDPTPLITIRMKVTDMVCLNEPTTAFIGKPT
jgi:hypothetical protein